MSLGKRAAELALGVGSAPREPVAEQPGGGAQLEERQEARGGGRRGAVRAEQLVRGAAHGR